MMLNKDTKKLLSQQFLAIFIVKYLSNGLSNQDSSNVFYQLCSDFPTSYFHLSKAGNQFTRIFLPSVKYLCLKPPLWCTERKLTIFQNEMRSATNVVVVAL